MVFRFYFRASSSVVRAVVMYSLYTLSSFVHEDAVFGDVQFLGVGSAFLM